MSSHIKAYLYRIYKLNKKYFDELVDLVKTTGFLSPDRKIIFVVPVSSQEKNVYCYLSNFINQVNINYNIFEIFLFFNSISSDADFNILLAQVVQFRHDYPHINISYTTKVFENTVPMGLLRKMINDLTLVRSYPRNLLIVNNDVDIINLSNTYIHDLLISRSNKSNYLGYGISNVDYFEKYLNKNSLFLKLLKLYHYVDEEINKSNLKKLPIRVHCYNLAYTAKLYALNRGFKANINIGEDLSFGYNAYFNFSKKVFKKLNTKLTVSYRRILQAYAKKMPVFLAWEDFETSQLRIKYDIFEQKLTDELDNRFNEREKFNYFCKEVNLFFDYFIEIRIPILQNKLDRIKNMSQNIKIAKSIFKKVLYRIGYNMIFLESSKKISLVPIVSSK